MPTYSYRCEACQREFDKEQRISEEPIRKCPHCGKLKARRMIASAGNFILKGGGWYSDGYGSGKSSSKSSTPSSESKSSSTDSTPVTSSD